MYKWIPRRLIAVFSAERVDQKVVAWHTASAEKNKTELRILYPAKLSFVNERKITFLDEQEVKESTASSHCITSNTTASSLG